MKQWQKDGKCLILCVDANKNINLGELGWQLMDLDCSRYELGGWGIHGKAAWATYFQGSEPINGIWATGDLTVVNACVMPVEFEVGNHQFFVINFITATLIGSGPHAIVRPALHRLNTKIEGCAQQYNKTL